LEDPEGEADDCDAEAAGALGREALGGRREDQGEAGGDAQNEDDVLGQGLATCVAGGEGVVMFLLGRCLLSFPHGRIPSSDFFYSRRV